MYARLCTCGTLHKKACRIGPGREGDRKPEKPGRHSSDGGEVASRLADNEIVLPSRTGYIPQMRDLSQFFTKSAARGLIFPLRWPRAGFSAGYPSKEAAWPQPADFGE